MWGLNRLRLYLSVSVSLSPFDAALIVQAGN